MITLYVMAALGLQPAAPAAGQERSFYEHMIDAGLFRVEEGRLRRGQPRLEPAVMEPLAWIEGEWERTDVILPINSVPAHSATSSTPVRWSLDRTRMAIVSQSTRDGSRPNRIASFDPYTRQWFSVIDEFPGFGTLTAPGWQDGRLDFEGPATFAGHRMTMRHSIVRTGPDSFEIQNSERLVDGSWRMFDRHVFRRLPAPANSAAE